jgi:predicted nucleic acid-binding protein
LYAHDTDAGAKHRTASALVRRLWDERDSVLTTQVLQEFYVTVRRKILTPLARREAGDILAASDLDDRYRLLFWDALILVSAAKANLSLLVTEDLQPGRRILDLKIQNPFVG